jgi:hypothetical protein
LSPCQLIRASADAVSQQRADNPTNKTRPSQPPPNPLTSHKPSVVVMASQAYPFPSSRIPPLTTSMLLFKPRKAPQPGERYAAKIASCNNSNFHPVCSIKIGTFPASVIVHQRNGRSRMVLRRHVQSSMLGLQPQGTHQAASCPAFPCIQGDL